MGGGGWLRRSSQPFRLEAACPSRAKCIHVALSPQVHSEPLQLVRVPGVTHFHTRTHGDLQCCAVRMRSAARNDQSLIGGRLGTLLLTATHAASAKRQFSNASNCTADGLRSHPHYALAVHQCIVRRFFTAEVRASGKRLKASSAETAYRVEWEHVLRADEEAGRRRAADAPTFLSVPWNGLVEILARNRKAPRVLRRLRQLFAALDWRRRHFIVLNQVALGQVYKYYHQGTGEVLQLPEMLLVFAASRAHMRHLDPRPSDCAIHTQRPCPRSFSGHPWPRHGAAHWG